MFVPFERIYPPWMHRKKRGEWVDVKSGEHESEAALEKEEGTGEHGTRRIAVHGRDGKRCCHLR